MESAVITGWRGVTPMRRALRLQSCLACRWAAAELHRDLEFQRAPVNG